MKSGILRKRIKQNFIAFRATYVVDTIVFVNIAASTITVILYYAKPIPLLWNLGASFEAPVYGTLLSYIISLFITWLVSFMARPYTVNRRSYDKLKVRLEQLKARLDVLKPSANTINRQAAYTEASRGYCRALEYISDENVGIQWLTGMGFISAWGQVHRIEEALIEIEPPEMALRGAMNDFIAIQNSSIKNKNALIARLIFAVRNLSRVGASYFNDYQGHEIEALLEQMESNIPQQNITPDEAESMAYAILREVRRTLNDFRNGLWEGLARARNKLLITMGVTGLVTHILLCFMIVMTAPVQAMLTAAIAFYIVGAITGLFGRLYNEARTASAVDDYGLTITRILSIPLLSGLAGVGGVLITVVLYRTFLTPAINGGVATLPDTFSAIFRLNEPSYLLTAAIFGLAPNLIISSLKQRAERYEEDLESSKVGAQTSR